MVFFYTRYLPSLCSDFVGHDSAVGIATRYGLDGPVCRIPLGTGFSAPVQTGPGDHPASYTMGTKSFVGLKRPGGGVGHPPPITAVVRKE